MNRPIPASITEALHEYDGQVPGAALLIIRDGRPWLSCGFGLAELETGRKVTPDTSFRLASITKQFTATMLLLLAQEGRLGIDDPVRRWLPEMPTIAEGMTLRHLVGHTSGLLDYEDLMDPADPRQVSDRDVLALLASQHHLRFLPGTGYRYNNGAYALLALVVERADGRPFAQCLHQRIFSPLGMSAVAHAPGRDDIAQRAIGYSQQQGRWQRTDQNATSAVLGDGGIYASIRDLARWDEALRKGYLLREPWHRLATTPLTSTDEPDVDHYAFGWRLHGADLHWHSGESIGFRNVILRWPARQAALVLLTNRNAPEPYVLARRMAAQWL